MAPKRRSSETDQQVIKRGSLIKSPPFYAINNRGSWKTRLFKLYKTMTDIYVLSYYDYDGVTENLKGDINVSDIKCIESGKNMKDKYIITIERLFNMAPENALYIKTENRNYYLIDNSVENIIEWQRCLTDVWMKMNQSEPVNGPRISHISLHATNQDVRPKSLPGEISHTKILKDETLDRQRSHTDPEPRKGHTCDLRDIQPWNQDERRLSTSETVRTERKISITNSDFTTVRTPETQSLSEQDPVSSRSSITDSIDGAYGSDTGDPIYDTPRSTNRESLDSAEVEGSDDTDRSDSEVYEPMTPQYNLSEKVHTCPPKPPRSSQVIDLHRYHKYQKSQLKKADIMKIWYEQDDEYNPEKININVPTEHLQKYLTLQEAGERLFVSNWKGPGNIGCVFHHGDRIEAINDIRLESKDFFTQMLNQSISPEVNVLVVRNKKAKVFHVEGCRCDTS